LRAEKLRHQRVFGGAIRGATQQTIDRPEHFGILVFRRATAREQATPNFVAHLIFNLTHERLDMNDVVGQSGLTVTRA
jgi:hypothetical protein